MTATVSTLMRHHDVSGVSGEGPIGTVVEFESGLTAFHWDTDTPSVTVYTDVRHVLQLHGHGGASTLIAAETRLEQAYRTVMPFLLAGGWSPLTCAPHPDHPDRLRTTFEDESTWRYWVALLDGSTHAASHEEVDGEMRHTWVHPDGNVWLVYHTPIPGRLVASERFVVPMDDDEDPLDNFHKEDRG